MISPTSRHFKALAGALVGLFFLAATQVANAQANVEVFGQNRVQYRRFQWKYFDTKHFRVYHYDRDGATLARYVAEQAERDISVVEQRMSGTFPRRFKIVLYNSYDEYRQSNIGLKFDNQIDGTPTGTVDIVGDKLVVYFDGVHRDLRRQIRAGMSQVVLQRALFGENFREVVRNSLLLNLPPWVSEGYLAYLVDGWDPEAESEWKNELSAHPKEGFYEISERKPELAGKAFWKWVSDRYGAETPRNLLYTMQLRSSLNQGLKLTLGMKVVKAYDSCVAWYKNVFAQDTIHQETPPDSTSLISIPMPKQGVITQVRVSPKGKDVAYCVFNKGQYFIYIQHTTHEQVRSMIMSTGDPDWNEKKPDPNYPLLSWSTNGYKLAILYREKTQTRLRIYNSLKARIENYVIPSNRFDRVLGMTFDEDNDQIIFSAIRKSQTDLYAFTIQRSRLTSITNDVWDDIEPQFISGGYRRGILFLSNRPAPNMQVPSAVNELPTGPMNVFFYDTKTQSPVLLQCSYNKAGHLSQPIQYGQDNFAFLLDTNGITNKYVVTFLRTADNRDSAVPLPVTNYSRSILSHQYNAAANLSADVLQVADSYKVYFGPLLIPGKNVTAKELQPTELRRNALLERMAPRPSSASNAGSTQQSGTNAMKRGNTFRTEFDDDDTSSRNLNATLPSDLRNGKGPDTDTSLLLNPLIKDSSYLNMRSRPYRLSFKPDFLQVRLDNTVLFTRYQSAGLHGNTYSNPEIGGLISVSLSDVMENHKFTGGLRLPVNFSGMTYFLQYQNFTRRIDWGALFMRTANFYTYQVSYADSAGHTIFVNDQLGKVSSYLLQGNAAYPLDRRRRVEFTLGLRQDVLDFKAEDTFSLSFSPRSKSNWVMGRLEYDFDNSIVLAPNIREGFRWKVYGEAFAGGGKGPNQSSGNFFNLGADFRYYKRIYRHSIFALRMSGAHSDGSQHVLYFLGGVDGWLSPRSGDTPPVTDQNYAFQALGSPLRGYEQNARNGNTYAMINMELRIPVLTTFMNRPINSPLLRNLQLVGFTDAGSAWNGWLPNSENTSRTYNVNSSQTPVSLQLTNFQSGGLAMGYGAGLRTTLLGYFARVDAAWNIDGRRTPIWYLAIGMDF